MAGVLEVAAALNAAINAHDVQAARLLMADDAELRLASGRRLDADGWARFLHLSFTAFPDLHIRVERSVHEGDTVASEETMTGTHGGDFAGLAATGLPVALPMLHVVTVAGDRISRLVAYHDTAGILRQLGHEREPTGR